MKKELRECLPWLLLAAIVFFVFGGLALWERTNMRTAGYRYHNFSPGSDVNSYQLTRHPALEPVGATLFFTSLGLGLALGVRQFWVADFIKTWGFMLHRSVSRAAVLWSKIAAAMVTFVVSVGTVWIALYLYACRPELFAIPPTFRVFIEGWLLVVLGFLVYLGTAIAGLSKAKWYTTKKVGLAFAVFILSMSFSQWHLGYVLAVVIIGGAILLVQVIDTFLRREF